MTIALDSDRFRAALRHHAAGVVVVTAPGENPAGFTATSFTSVSLDPPLVSFCLNRGASSWPAVSVADHVAVHVLADDQEQLARTFSTSGVDRFAAPTAWGPGPYGLPLLDGVSATLICRVMERVAAGDHTIVLAEPIEAAYAGGDRSPLLYHRGRYLRPA
jgi:flavin reductase (DIM6/NTAB) family NADH-FMN oxidoreductase RutF